MLVGALLAARLVTAAEGSAPTPSNPDHPLGLASASLLQLPDGNWQLGLVRLDLRKRTLSFPGAINMSTGAIEYAVVHVTGKVHESLVKTETNPLHIHLGRLLLLGAEQPAAPGEERPPELIGPPVTVWLQWQVEGASRRIRLEEGIRNTLTRSAMRRGPWIYGGSRVIEGTLLAQRDGSIAAIIADRDALINNPRPGRDDDEIWQANSEIVPVVGTPVEVIIEFAAEPEKQDTFGTLR